MGRGGLEAPQAQRADQEGAAAFVFQGPQKPHVHHATRLAGLPFTPQKGAEGQEPCPDARVSGAHEPTSAGIPKQTGQLWGSTFLSFGPSPMKW